MMTAREQSVTVDRLKLIEKLKENLAIHVQDYEEAKQGYRVKLKRDLENALSFFDEKSYEAIAKLEVRAAPPVSYAKQYEDAITMLEWSTQETIVLDKALFSQYVQNEWAWSNAVLTSNTFYKGFVGSIEHGA